MKAVLQKHQRRDRLNIIADIVSLTIGGSLKTQVMYRANLSFSQVNEYLPLLLELRLLAAKTTKGRTVYRTTSKGARFLRTYTEIRSLLKTKGKPEAEDNSVIYTKNGNCYKTKE